MGIKSGIESGMEPEKSEPPGANANRNTWLPASHAERAFLFLVLAVGASLRVNGLTDHGLWIDEYGTWWAVAAESWTACWSRVLEIHGQSPLYYLIVRFSVDLLGDGTRSLRFPSLLFGVGLLALAYPLSIRIFRDTKIALFAVAAFAVNERLIYYSQEARPYALALLLAGCSFYFYARLLDRDGLRTRIGYVLTTALTYYAHYFFGIIVVAQIVHLLATQPQRWRTWSATFVVLGLSLAPGLWQLHALFSRRGSLDWIAPPAGWVGSLEPAIELLDPAVLGLTAAASLAAWARSRSTLRGSLGANGSIAIFWFAVPALVFAVAPPLVGINLGHSRYLVVAAPAVPLIYGVLISLPSQLPNTGLALRTLPLVVFLSSTILLRIVPLTAQEGNFWWFYQHGWKSAVSDIVRGFQPGDLILYRTHFVELDQLVRGDASPTTREFVEWPILAHLPEGREFVRRALPYTDDPTMRVRLRSIINEATRAQRLWIVGLEVNFSTRQRSVLTRAVEIAKQHHDMRVRFRRKYGLVHVLLLEPADGPMIPTTKGG
jgi:hypothetical protein